MQQTWIYYSILAGIMIGFADTLNKYLINDKVDLRVMLLYKFILAAIVTTGLIYFTMPHKKIVKAFTSVKKHHLGLMIIGAFITTCLIYSSFKAIEFIPNTAYASGIKGSIAVAAVFLGSVLFFEGKFNLYTILGLILVGLGANLIRVYS
tara:strand:- start:197 stop:646 length:450 start_codon:yes stop_codon:yes gene_type:complete